MSVKKLCKNSKFQIICTEKEAQGKKIHVLVVSTFVRLNIQNNVCGKQKELRQTKGWEICLMFGW